MHYTNSEFEQFPEILNLEQMCKACHISKLTALYLFQYDLIPYVNAGERIRFYIIRKSDIISFMNDREENPDKYKPPRGWYHYGYMDCPLYLREHPPALSPKRMRSYYKRKLQPFPDVMTVADVSAFTGYNRHTVGEWIRKGKVRPLVLIKKYMIPKCYLIDWLCSGNTTA